MPVRTFRRYYMAGVALPMPPPPPRFAVYAHPWALAEMGVDAALDELADLGVDGLQLALSYHVASFLTPRSPRCRVHAGDLGSVSMWLDPPPSGLRPSVDTQAASAVPEIKRRDADREIQVVAWLVYLYNHDLASRYPEAAVRNAFGDAHPAQLCPSQPAVRDYVLTLTAAALDLGSSCGGMGGVHAESLSFLPWDYGLLGLKSSVHLDGEPARALGLCFCEACKQRAGDAGLDPDSLARAARDLVNQALVTMTAQGTDANELTAYENLLSEVTLELNREVAEMVKTRELRFSSTAGEPSVGRSDHSSSSAVRALVDEVRVKLSPGLGADHVETQREDALTGCKPGTQVFAQYQLHQFSTFEALAAAVDTASSVGIDHHRFYEHSVMTQEQVDWLRQVREAVRT